jgi:hypothetical protein
MFAAPSPKGTNYQGLFLNSAGELFDRSGRRWGRSQIAKMAQDAMPDLHGAVGAGEKSDYERREGELKAEMQKLCDEFDLHDEVAAAVIGLVDKHFPSRSLRGPGPNATLGKGAGARDRGPLDRHRGPGGDEDEDDAIVERIREFLASKGLDDEVIEEALKRVRTDREAAAKDRLPVGHARRHGRPPFRRVQG